MLALADSVLYAHYSHVQPEDWPIKWFTPRELSNRRGDGSILVNYDAIQKLDAMRELFGKPLFINSAYRNPEYNKSVGGATRSMHVQGRAFDIAIRDYNKDDLIAAAKEVGFTGFGITYNTFIHVDTGRPRQW